MSALSLLRTISFFRHIDDKELDYLKSRSHIRCYEKNSIVFMQGDLSQNFYVVVDGWIKLFRETLDGQESVTGLCTTGNMLGETSLFQENAYPMSAQSIDGARVIEIPGAVVRERIAENSDLALSMLHAYSKYTQELELQVEHLSVMTAPQRIGCFLLKLCPPGEEGKAVITLPYDKSLVASYLGVQRETFSRSLKKLQNTGIHTNGAVVTINSVADLKDYVCNSCSNPDGGCVNNSSKDDQHLCFSPKPCLKT